MTARPDRRTLARAELRAAIERCRAQDAGEARVVVTFRDGATGATPFASRKLAEAWGERFALRRGGTFTHDGGAPG